ncbi:MAG TPA: DUF1993 domain-containing protein [Gammaproteobacteria bacterium]|nr:DUF1993 domain-containing protein [Gammaproteobacteria bacterium]
MQLTMYQATAPTFMHMLANLEAVLKKGEAHALAKKIEPSVLLNARLAPDMFSLVRQVQIASDQVKGCMSRLAGTEPPRFEDNEQSFAELYARIQKTIAHIKSFKPEQIDGTDGKKIELKQRDGSSRHFQGVSYVFDAVFPNFFFHVTTAYDILRHNGVELSKTDFLGANEHVKRG